MEDILLFFAEGTEEIEALTVVDVLRRAGLPVKIVSVTAEKVVAGAHGIRVVADSCVNEVDFGQVALVVLPGGLPGAYNLAASQELANGIRTLYEAGKPLAAICAAPLVYGRMGLLNGCRATCYPGFEEELAGATCTGALVQEDGQFITGKGPAAAIEFALAIVTRLAGADVAAQVKSGMLYQELGR